jgi:hypothetical protein
LCAAALITTEPGNNPAVRSVVLEVQGYSGTGIQGYRDKGIKGNNPAVRSVVLGLVVQARLSGR